METIINFFNNPYFVIIGWISTIIVISSFGYWLYLWWKWILPILYRLGLWLSNRKIAIFAKGDNYTSLQNLIDDSKIFSSVIKVNDNDMKKVENETVFLVYWKDFWNNIDYILNLKKDTTALVVYAPYEDGRIDDESMKKINSHRNSIVVNFRWRLLNDILVSLITTSYIKR